MALGKFELTAGHVAVGGLVNIDLLHSKENDVKTIIGKCKQLIYDAIGKDEKYIYAAVLVAGYDWSTLFEGFEDGYLDYVDGILVYKTAYVRRDYRYSVTGGLFLHMYNIINKPEDLTNSSYWSPCATELIDIADMAGIKHMIDPLGITEGLFGLIDIVKLPYDSTGHITIIVQSRSQKKETTGIVFPTSSWSPWTPWDEESPHHITLHYDTKVPRLSNLKLEVVKDINPMTGKEFDNPLHDYHSVQLSDRVCTYQKIGPLQYERIETTHTQGALKPFLENFRVDYKLTGHLDNANGILFMINRSTKTFLYRNVVDDFNRGLKVFLNNDGFLRKGEDFELYREGAGDVGNLLAVPDDLLKMFLANDVDTEPTNKFQTLANRIKEALKNGVSTIKELFNNIDYSSMTDDVSIQDFINYLRDEFEITNSYEVHVHRPENILDQSSDLFLESLIGSTSVVYCNTLAPSLKPYNTDTDIIDYLKVDGCDCELSVEISNMESSRITFNPVPRDQAFKLQKTITVKDNEGRDTDKKISHPQYPKILDADGKDTNTERTPLYDFIYNNVSVTTEQRQGIKVPAKYASRSGTEKYNSEEGWAIYIKDLTKKEETFSFLENVTLEKLSENGDTVKLKFRLPAVRHDYVVKVRALNVESGLVGELYLFNYSKKYNQIAQQPHRPDNIDTDQLIAYPTIHTKGAVDVWKDEHNRYVTTPFVYARKDGKLGWQQATPFVAIEDSENPDVIKWQMCD